jgi:hypothetical protein
MGCIPPNLGEIGCVLGGVGPDGPIRTHNRRGPRLHAVAEKAEETRDHKYQEDSQVVDMTRLGAQIAYFQRFTKVQGRMGMKESRWEAVREGWRGG